MWALTREIRMLAGLADSIRNGADLSTAMRQARVWQSRQGTGTRLHQDDTRRAIFIDC